MPDHAYPVVDIFKSTWGRCSFVSEWIRWPVFSFLHSIPLCRHYLHVGTSVTSSDCKLISEETANNSLSLVMDIIEIDSSESEDDVGIGQADWQDIYSDDDATDQQRITSTRYNGPNYDAGVTGRSHVFGANMGYNNRSGEPSNVSHGGVINNPQSSSQNANRRILPHSIQHPSFKDKIGSHEVSTLTSKQKEPIQMNMNSDSRQYLNNNAHNAPDRSSTYYQKRSLPSSFQRATYKPAPEGSRDHQGKKDVYENDGKHRVPPTSVTNGKFVISTQPRASTMIFGANAADGDYAVHLNGTGGTLRVLPPSLMHGRSIKSPEVVSTTDASVHLGLVEEHIEYDERPIYQEALQNLVQPKMEDDLPEGILTVTLLKHQKIALAWMVQKEMSRHCAGGILADDQGLGKTVSMISLIQKQITDQHKFTSDNSHHTKPEALNLDEDDDATAEADKPKQPEKDDVEREQVAGTSVNVSHNWRPAAGTLVVCPASIVRQWARELDEKVTSSAKLSVLIYHGGTRTKDPGDLAKHDVVITTYSLVTNEVPKQSLADDDDGEQKNLDKYSVSPEFSTSKKRKQTSNAWGKGKKKGKGLKDSPFDYDSGPLARVRWFRVILDEAQTIKNHRTQVARACSGLRAKRRWCLSGTPIQNSIDDLFSYFRFLKYDPYCNYSSFCSSIKYPISRDSINGYKKLQAVLRIVLLRRAKDTLINGEPVIKLPPKSISLKKIDFSPEERSFYLKLEADSRQQFKAYAAAGTLKQNYANILLMLLRLRQACDHPILVKGYQSEIVEKDSLDMARQLPTDMLRNLLQKLETAFAICGACNDPPEDAVVTMCGHVFCYQCVSERLTGDDNLCPASGCKDILGTDSVFSRATLRRCISDESDDNGTTSSSAHYEESSILQDSYVSSKIKAAVEILNSLGSPNYDFGLKECGQSDWNQDRNSNAITEVSHYKNGKTHTCAYWSTNSKIPVKAIVFSQWTSMLDLLELSLNQSLIPYRRLDGTMSLNSRDRAVKDFNDDPEVTVMIMSLKAGNLGLNMVAACHVILLDLWWNPTTEDQAVDRAHRIGQTRPVTVSRLTIKDTVEDRILSLQEEKRKLVSSAFGEDKAGNHATKLTVEDLRYLFKV